jgi:hypothetical protein
MQVVIQCLGGLNGKPWQKLGGGELRFIGGDTGRPFWVDPDKPGHPIENSSWFVSHWRPFPAFPDPRP